MSPVGSPAETPPDALNCAAGDSTRGFIVGTRGSALALAQTQLVVDALTPHLSQPLDVQIITTHGDTTRAHLVDLAQQGHTGVFANAIRRALLEGQIDLAVHSCKDLPADPCPGLEILAMPPRGATADCLCTTAGWTLETLPEGARVGTGSPRRAAQLLRVRPDLRIVPIRGNIERRLRCLEEPTPDGEGGSADVPLDAVVLAEAGLQRLATRQSAAQQPTAGSSVTAPSSPTRRSVTAQTLSSAHTASAHADTAQANSSQSDTAQPDTVLRYISERLPFLPSPAQGALALEVRMDSTPEPLRQALLAINDQPTLLAATAERALLRTLHAGCELPIGAEATARVHAETRGVELTLRAEILSPDGRERNAAEYSVSVPQLAWAEESTEVTAGLQGDGLRSASLPGDGLQGDGLQGAAPLDTDPGLVDPAYYAEAHEAQLAAAYQLGQMVAHRLQANAR